MHDGDKQHLTTVDDVAWTTLRNIPLLLSDFSGNCSFGCVDSVLNQPLMTPQSPQSYHKKRDAQFFFFRITTFSIWSLCLSKTFFPQTLLSTLLVWFSRLNHHAALIHQVSISDWTINVNDIQVIDQIHWAALATAAALYTLQLLVMCQQTTPPYQQPWKPARHLAEWFPFYYQE